jgi:hypothetical protein
MGSIYWYVIQELVFSNATQQCCGSGSGIRCFLTSVYGSGIRFFRTQISDPESPKLISGSIVKIFWVKIL